MQLIQVNGSLEKKDAWDDLVLSNDTGLSFLSFCIRDAHLVVRWAGKSSLAVKVNRGRKYCRKFVQHLIGDLCALQVILKSKGFAHRKIRGKILK